MAINQLILTLVKETIKNHSAQQSEAPIECLELGYPDLLVSANEIDFLFGGGTAQDLTIRRDSKKIAQWHGYSGVEEIFDTHSLWKKLRINPTTIDIQKARGCEQLVDLNYPIPAHLKCRFDLVIDTGTLEHCFNVGQAMINLFESLKVGGVAIHAFPLNRYNHGFWSANPTLYHDFCADNDLSIQWFRGVTLDNKIFELPAYQRFKDIPENTAIIACIRRDAESELVFPIQHKYRDV